MIHYNKSVVIEKYLILEKLILVIDNQALLKIWLFDDVFESVVCKNDSKCLIQEEICKSKEKITSLKEISFMNRIGPDGSLFFIIGDNFGKTKIYSVEKKAKIPNRICLKYSSNVSFESNAATTDIIICDPYKMIFTSSSDNKITLFDQNLIKLISLEYHNRSISGLKFADNFSFLISFDVNNQLFQWNCSQFFFAEESRRKTDSTLRKHGKKKENAHPSEDNGNFFILINIGIYEVYSSNLNKDLLVISVGQKTKRIIMWNVENFEK